MTYFFKHNRKVNKHEQTVKLVLYFYSCQNNKYDRFHLAAQTLLLRFLTVILKAESRWCIQTSFLPLLKIFKYIFKSDPVVLLPRQVRAMTPFFFPAREKNTFCSHATRRSIRNAPITRFSQFTQAQQ